MLRLIEKERLKSVKIKEVVSALERFAPLPLQEGFDNAGLQVGLTEAEVSGALLCLDVTESIVDEAIEKGCNLIVSHHPLVFHPLKRLTYADYVQRAVAKAIKNDITILSMHTNMDNAEGGVNFKTFDVESVQCNQLLRRPIRKVAICGGAGSFLLPDAIRLGADAFVTGEMHYHEYFAHEQEIQIAVIGHYQSEQFTKEIFKSIIEDECKGVRAVLSDVNTNPIIYL